MSKIVVKIRLVMFIAFVTVTYTCRFINKDFENEELKLALALKYAKANSIELKKVIEYYSENSADSLKLRSAKFLISNMMGKGYEEFIAVNNQGIQVNFDFSMLKGGDKDLSLNFFKYQELNKTSIGFRSNGFIEDIHVISADYLIENIEYAFKVWDYPWAKKLSFNQFKELILPYRIRQEPLQPWRKDMFELMSASFKKNLYLSSIEVATIINDKLKNRYKYLHNDLSFYPGRLSFNQIEAIKGGRCDDLNAYVGCLLRSIGVPVALEFTPSWANSNYGGHSWLGVFHQGIFTVMNAVYDNPIKGKLPFNSLVLPKAYREEFLISNTTLSESTTSEDLLRIKNNDITREYIQVKDQFKIKLKNPQMKNAVFLGVLNGPEWVPVDQGAWEEDGYAKFKNVGVNAVYAVIQKKNGIHCTISPPFILDSSLKVKGLNVNNKRMQNVKIRVSDISRFLFQKECFIAFWDGESQTWIECGEKTILSIDPKLDDSNRKYVTFYNVPCNGLYRVINSKIEKSKYPYGRPFAQRDGLALLHSF